MIKETNIQDEDILDVATRIKQDSDTIAIDDPENIELIEDNDEGEDNDEVDEIDDSDVDLVQDDNVNVNQAQAQSQATNKTPTTTTNTLPIAKNFTELAKSLMKPIPDYPVVESTHNVWEIKDWNGLKENKVRGPSFKCGGFVWNILLFPNGNNNNQLAIYIEPHPDVEEGVTPPDNWYVCAQFGLDIWNPNHPESHISSGSYHRFNKNESDWGFSNFIDLKNLYSNNFLQRHQNSSATAIKPHAILETNQLNITAYVKVIDDSSTGVLWHSFNQDYDSKASTGYVGLNNQGATCYLNSLLQSYYTTKNFRKMVYQIPTESHSNGKSVPLSLQRIFYQLTHSNDPVGTLELTKSFGWDSSDAFTQHDVQELNRILMDKLESAMKGTPIEGSLTPIFVGKMKSYIKCVNVPYESSRVEDFWDIQLNVKGFANLKEAFQNYIEVEMLEGENKYQAGEQYGYQDAKKGVVFESFPPVLHLQLKRFEYDFRIDDLVKIDDNFEFPDSIDLSPYLDEVLSKEIKSDNWTYKLHGVLVHQGSISNGHYYAMIKPSSTSTPRSTWLRFDDDKVWKVTPNQVFHENFGAKELATEQLMKMTKGEQNEYLMRRTTSAYMLVYYRESKLDEILLEGGADIEASIPSYVPTRLKEEEDQRLKIERAKQEALYYVNVKVVTNKNFSKYDSFDLYPDARNERFYEPTLFDPESNPLVFKFKKEDSFRQLYIEIGKKLLLIDENLAENEIDISTLPYRLVTMNHRNNHTNRSDKPIPDDLLDSTAIQIFHECFNRKYDDMCFYVEEKNKDLSYISQSFESGTKSPNDFSFDDSLRKIDQGISGNKFNSISENSTYIMLFVKYFDPISGSLRGLTHVTVMKDELIKSLLKPINRVLGFPDSTHLLVFEELSPNKLDVLQIDTTFEKSELSNGDILCVQPFEHNGSHDIKEFYKFLLTRFHVRASAFHPNEEEEDTDFVEDPSDVIKTNEKTELSKSFDFWISIQSSYLEFATEIAKHIKVDPTYLRIFAVNHHKVKFPLKRATSIQSIFGKTVNASQITNFEYEVLSIPLEEYENMKLIKFNWVSSLVHYQTFEFLVPKKSQIGEDLLTKLLHRVQIGESELPNLLIWSGINHKYVDIIKFDREISTIPDNFELFGGILPAEVETLVNYDMVKRYELTNSKLSGAASVAHPETNANTGTANGVTENEVKEIQAYELEQVRTFNRKLNMIPGFHFYKNSSYHHGVPFIFPVFPGEKFPETKARMRAKMGLGVKEFDKIKFALADINDKGVYIDHENNEFILYDEIKKHPEQLSLALDHPDRSPRRQTQFDRGISIK